MAVIVTFDEGTRTGTVTYNDGVDSSGATVEGTENKLLQLAIDRATANTARVTILQTQLQDQSDQINHLNHIFKKLLDATSTDPAKKGDTFTLSAPPKGQYFTAEESTLLGQLKDDRGDTLLSYFSGGIVGVGTVSLYAGTSTIQGKSMSDLQGAIKSALNQATNLNQQTMINYQSLINQRNQMTEWVANLIKLLTSAASAMTNNLK